MTEQDKDFLLGCSLNAKDMSERIEKETKDGYVSPYYILEKAEQLQSYAQAIINRSTDIIEREKK